MMSDLPVLPIKDVANLMVKDEAFEQSVTDYDTVKMSRVLRTHGYNDSYECAQYAIMIGEEIMNIKR